MKRRADLDLGIEYSGTELSGEMELLSRSQSRKSSNHYYPRIPPGRTSCPISYLLYCLITHGTHTTTTSELTRIDELESCTIQDREQKATSDIW